MVKKISNKLMLVTLFFISLGMAVGSGQELFSWYTWWSTDRSPIELVGYVDRIESLRGRDHGDQYLYFVSNGGEHRLDTVFSKKQIKNIPLKGESIFLKYYPTATGKKYVFFMLKIDGERKLYEGKFHDEGWLAIMVCIFICFYISLMFFSFLYLVKPFKKI